MCPVSVKISKLVNWLFCSWKNYLFLKEYFNCLRSKTIIQCVKGVRIRSYSGPHFLAFGLNTERYGVSLHIQSKCGKMRTRITPNADTFYTVIDLWLKPILREMRVDIPICSWDLTSKCPTISLKLLGQSLSQLLGPSY